LACYLTAAGASNGRVDPDATRKPFGGVLDPPTGKGPKKEHPPPIWASIDEGPLWGDRRSMEVSLYLTVTLASPRKCHK
jgi:hypothetical protein